jgi:hypothetical protein
VQWLRRGHAADGAGIVVSVLRLARRRPRRAGPHDDRARERAAVLHRRPQGRRDVQDLGREPLVCTQRSGRQGPARPHGWCLPALLHLRHAHLRLLSRRAWRALLRHRDVQGLARQDADATGPKDSLVPRERPHSVPLRRHPDLRLDLAAPQAHRRPRALGSGRAHCLRPTLPQRLHGRAPRRRPRAGLRAGPEQDGPDDREHAAILSASTATRPATPT